MGIGGSLRELARFLEECEETGRVGSVDLAGGIGAGREGALTADVEVALSTCPPDGDAGEVSLEATGVGTDGRLRLAFESTDAVVPTTGHDVEIDVTDATVAPDGTVRVTVTASVPTGRDREAGDADADETTRATGRGTGGGCDGDAALPDRAGTSTGAAVDEPDGTVADGVPPFRDPDLLAEVYESCDTFAEMTDALGMDVTAETVRRYMIDYGIHEPRSYDTSRSRDAGGPSDGADERPTDQADDVRTAEDERDDELQSPVVLADGIGLPDEVTVDAIVEAVRTSDTVYEVKRDIGLERGDTLALLRELDLLDLVVGRLATEREREISREQVVDHLRQRAEGG